MKKIVVLTAVGSDKPGIVAGVTGKLYELGCNLEETSMTRLRNEFAMIMLISIPDPMTTNKLQEELTLITKKLGLSINLRELSDKDINQAYSTGKPNHILTVYGIDKPGIVYNIAQILAQKQINITDLQTQTTTSAKRDLYALILEIFVPEKINTAELKSEIGEICEKLSVDYSLDIIHEYEEM